MDDLVAQWLKHESEVTNIFMMARVQILHFFSPTPYSQFFFFLYIGFSDHLLSFLPHFLTFIVVSRPC